MEAHLNKTELNDRTVWSDGDCTVNADEIARLVAEGLPTDQVFVDQLTDEIRQFNRNVPKDQQITVKQSVRDHSLDWNLPDEYKQLDVYEYLLDRLEQYANSVGYDINSTEADEPIPRHIVERILRCSYELTLYRDHDLYDVLRALIYIINTLQAKNVVWGVGRGSSVSSYILYLIGVHDVDSVKYGLDIHDFLPPVADDS